MDTDEQGLLKGQLELTEGLLKAKQAELDQHKIIHIEEIKLWQNKLEAKECEISLLRKMEENWKKKESDWKSQLKKRESDWETDMRNKESEWETEMKSKESACKEQLDNEKKEKKDAIDKLNAIVKFVQDSVMDKDKEGKGEYMEEFSPDDKNAVKRKLEAVEGEGGSQKKAKM